jgi:hypothetical protein
MQTLSMKIRGLYTHSNELSEVPEGSLAVADDIVINRDSIAEPRRGFDVLDTGFSNTAFRANKLFFYKDKLIAHYSSNLMGYYSGGVWTPYSTTHSPLANPDTTSAFTTVKMKAAESNQNFYFTTSTGIYKLEQYNGTPKPAGAYKALDVDATMSGTATAAWLAQDYRVAYRIIWGYTDENNNLILGSPSQRSVITNTSTINDVTLAITIPDGITTNWFYQVYRSAAVDNSSSDVEPSDELGLVYEGNPVARNFSTYTKTFVDAGVDTGTEIITSVAHGFSNGDAVTLTSTGTLPTGITAGSVYYIISATTDTFKLSTTYAGSAVNITDNTGGGTHTIAGANLLAVVDITPDDLRGATIYTAATQEGLVYQNEPPPQALDIAVFKNCLFFGNIKSKYRYYLSLVSAGLAPGVVNGDTIAVQVLNSAGAVTTTTTYTGAAAESIAARQFKVFTAGSAAQNITDTALSLVRVINRNSTSPVSAYYISGPDDLPGKILLEEEAIGGFGFAIISSRATCWSPQLPSSGITEAATNDSQKNGIAYSKPSRPDAVPLPNRFFAGSADKNILRVIALRDSLFILKEDGIYKISGQDSGSFQIELVDSSTKILAPESAVVLNNQIYALTDQGVVAITDSGVQVKSRPIESTILSLQGADLDNLKNLSFAVSYETERKYILFIPTATSVAAADQAFVFNSFTSTWTRWPLTKTCGAVSPTEDKLYLGDGNSNLVNQERKAYSNRDYVDYLTTTTVTSVSGTTITLTNSDQINIGDIIYRDDSYVVVASVDSTSNTITTTFTALFTVGTAEILTSIKSKVKWVPFTAGNPGIVKQFREALLLFKADFQGDATLRFTSDLSPAYEDETISGSGQGFWGLFNWGSAPWGGSTSRRPIRTYVPRNKQRATQMSLEFRHQTGFTSYQLAGVSLTVNSIGERVAK